MTLSPAPPLAAADGPSLFVRFAYPPNELGYCGPPDSAALLGAAASGREQAAVESMVRRFDGAWPYLQLIAWCNGLRDPLDRRVVEAYWIGNQLLEAVQPSTLVASLEERFDHRAGRNFEQMATAAFSGGVAQHSFHVFAVYPWLGLLRSGMDVAPLTVLDRCRIRWGHVLQVDGDYALVRGQALSFMGGQLGLGSVRLEMVRYAVDGLTLLDPLAAGDVVALHWDWVCHVLTPRELRNLRRTTALNLRAVNSMAHPGPAVACGA